MTIAGPITRTECVILVDKLWQERSSIQLPGSYENAQVYTVLACSGIVLGAVYMLSLYKRMIMGKAESGEVRRLNDMNPRELLMFVPLVFLLIPALLNLRSRKIQKIIYKKKK